MVSRNRKRDRNREAGDEVVESPEEAMEAIANALDFLRREAAALGMQEVSDMIGRVRVCVRSGSVVPGKARRH